MNEKILIGCTTYSGKEYVLERYINRVKELTFNNYEVLFIDNSKEDDYFNKIKSLGMNVIKSPWNERSKIRLTNAQNILRDKFLEGDYTHLFILEQDLIPPRDIIETLLSHDKDVVSGWYYITEVPRPCLSREWELLEMKFCPKQPLMVEMAKERLMKCFLASFGVSLIKREVLEKIRFKAYHGFTQHADTWFFFDCEKNGFGVYVDTDLLIPHFQDYKWGEILNKDKEIEKDFMKLKEEEEIQ